MFKRYSLGLAALCCAWCVPVRAGMVLEFFTGTSVNDTIITVANPLTPVTLHPGESSFVQVVMRQTNPTALFDGADGLAAYLVQGIYGSGQAGVFIVPASNGFPTGTSPKVNVAYSPPYSLVRSYRTGVNGSSTGGTAATATAFRFGGLNLNPPPLPTVDANQRIFLGTFQIDAVGAGSSSIVFADPNPAPGTVDNITDNGDNIDAVLFNGATYPLPIHVIIDQDGDGIPDDLDNCPSVANPGQ